MAITQIESWSELFRFYRRDREVFIGNSPDESHLDLVRRSQGIEGPFPDPPRATIEYYKDNLPEDGDMGFVSRQKRVIEISGTSGTFNYPPEVRRGAARKKTLKILKKIYPDEEFMPRS